MIICSGAYRLKYLKGPTPKNVFQGVLVFASVVFNMHLLGRHRFKPRLSSFIHRLEIKLVHLHFATFRQNLILPENRLIDIENQLINFVDSFRQDLFFGCFLTGINHSSKLFEGLVQLPISMPLSLIGNRFLAETCFWKAAFSILVVEFGVSAC